MGEADLKAALLAGEGSKNTDDTQKVETRLGVITVRGLTRAEVLRLKMGQERGKIDHLEFEQRMVSLGLVDPEMTPQEVATWQATERAGGALADVTEAIAELSGMGEGADKSSVPEPGV